MPERKRFRVYNKFERKNFFLRNTRVILHIRASLTDNNLEITCQGRQNTREVKTNLKGTKMVKDRKHGNRF